MTVQEVFFNGIYSNILKSCYYTAVHTADISPSECKVEIFNLKVFESSLESRTTVSCDLFISLRLHIF